MLNEMPVHKKQELADRINSIVEEFHPHDLFTLLALIQGSVGVKAQVLGAVKDYLNSSNMGVTMQ